jgi:hypothetical protein
MPGKGNPFLKFRVDRKYDALLRLDARKQQISVSELGRRIVKDHYQRVWDTQSSGVGHLEALTNLTKQYIARAQLARQTPTKVPMKAAKEPGLPGSEKRDKLEDLVWQGLKEAFAYSKTEDAAKDAEARLLALRVANGLARTELAILRHQDDAFVGALLEELGADADGLARKTQKGS